MKNEQPAKLKKVKEAKKEVKEVAKETVDSTLTKDTSVVPNQQPTVIEEDNSSYSLRTAELDFSTEVYDEAEIASALEIGFIAHALEMHKAKVAPEKHPDFDGQHCVDCDDEIPELRLSMGRVRCVHCQEFLEKKSKLR
jgi:RNA polymerase-binding transcription factor DksA